MEGKFKNLNLAGWVREIISTATFKESSITFAGTFINGLLGAAFYIASARFLGPANFGILSVSIVTLALVADIGDFGTNTGLVRFISKYLKEEPEKAQKYQKLGLEIKLFVSLLIFILGYLLAPFIAGGIFSKPEMIILLRISFLGVGTTLLFSFITDSLQSYQRFWAWSVVQIFTNFLRLGFIIVFFSLSILNTNSTLTTYILMPFLGFVIGLAFISKNFIRVKNELMLAKEFFQYTKWVGAFLVLSSLGSRLDSFISARLLSVAELGLYSAATQLVQVVPQIISAIGTVIAPKMSAMKNVKEMLTYFKKVQLMVIGIATLGIAAIPIASYLIPLLFGKSYMGTVKIFIVLLLAMLIFLVSVPIHNTVIYYFSYPKLFFWISLGHLSIVAFIGWNLILRYGAIGIAYSVVIAQTFDLVVPTIWTVKKIKQQKVPDH